MSELWRQDQIPDEWRELLLLIPGYDSLATAGDCLFDADEATLRIGFFHEVLKHVKGEKAGTPFILERWQQAIVANLFGWKRPDGTRRYRKAFMFVPRKNGKTPFAAGLLLSILVMDGEPGAEIYGAAAEYQQACLVFEHARGMVRQEPSLRSRLGLYDGSRKAITFDKTSSAYRVISADAHTKHGFNTHCAVIDELHAQPNSELVDVLDTSIGARRQPLIVYLSTSDFERPDSICNEVHDYAAKVRDGIIAAESFLPILYEASRDDDWTAEETWRKANPNLGVSVSLDYVADACQRARDQPRFQNEFKRLHLNIRTEQAVRWLPMDRWDACPPAPPDSALLALPCWAGLDLAKTNDIAALALIWRLGRDTDLRQLFWPDIDRDLFVLKAKFWAPEESAREREKRDKIPYTQWARDGLIKLTPGNQTDYAVIRADIVAMLDTHDIRSLAFDSWNASHFIQELSKDVPYPCVEFRQSIGTFTGPTKEFEGFVCEGRLVHGGEVIMRWMASNAQVKTDASGNIRPVKPEHKNANKIDGIVAGIMALSQALTVEEDTSTVHDDGYLMTV